jgi:hypothetical protein
MPLGRRTELLRLLFELAVRKDSALSPRRVDVDLERGEIRPLFKPKGRHYCNRGRDAAKSDREALVRRPR